MNAPDTETVLAGLHATTTRDDATRLAQQLKTTAAWALFLGAALTPVALFVAVAIGGLR